MLDEIVGEPFQVGQRVYVFEYGEGVFEREGSYDSEREAVGFHVDIGGESIEHWSPWCFAIREDGRRSRLWRMRDAVIEITYDPILLFNRGDPTWVRYGESDKERELIPTNGRLHKDWEGRGIQFPMIIEKWLRRLNGEVIPLSDYYNDPFNRFLDNLGADE